jgi:hypothetical protein
MKRHLFFIALTALIALPGCSDFFASPSQLAERDAVAARQIEAIRGERARETVRDLRSRFGDLDVGSIGVSGPSRLGAENAVRRFGRYAAVPFTNRAPDYTVAFTLQRDPSASRRSHATQTVRVFLLRNLDVDGAASTVVAETSQTLRCFDWNREERAACDERLSELAEALLYLLDVQ